MAIPTLPLGAVLGLILCAAVWAAPAPPPGAAAGAPAGTERDGSHPVRMSEWLGKPVSDRQGNDVGQIADFALNPDTGSIVYAVVDLAGVVENGHIAVPLTAFRSTTPVETVLTLEVTPVAWQQAPRFGETNWPREPSLAAEVDQRPAPATTTAVSAEAQRAAQQSRVAERTQTARRSAEFSRLDRDGDGFLDQQELEGRALLAEQLGDLDADDDGRISRSEFAAFEDLELLEPDFERGEPQVDGAAP